MANEAFGEHSMDRLKVCIHAKDWPGARAAGEELLQTLGDTMPDGMGANIHYLVADAILSMPAVPASDLEAAMSHLQKAVKGLVADAEGVAGAYIYLGKVHVALGKRGDCVALQSALDALTRACEVLATQPGSHRLGVAHYIRGQAYENLGPDNVETLERALAEYVVSYNSSGAAGRHLNKGTAAYHVGRVLIELGNRSRSETRRAEAIPYLEEAKRAYRAGRLDDQAVDVIKLLEQAQQSGSQERGEQPRRAAETLASKPETTREQPSESASSQVPPEEHVQAMKGIRSAQFRPVFLQKWIECHVSAELERHNFLYQSIFLPVMSEVIATAEEAERRRDSELQKLAEKKALDAKMCVEYLHERDRTNSTHDAALTILRDHLEHGQPFVLFLRNFDIEVRKGRIQKSKEHLFNPNRFPVQHMQNFYIRTKSEQTMLAEAIPGHIPILAISDVADVLQPSPSKRIARLRVLSNEWDLVAAMLIGEAAAIVLFTRGLSESLDTEFDLIKDLGATKKMSVLLIRPDTDNPIANFLYGDQDTRDLSFAVVYEAVLRRLGERGVQIEEFSEDDEKIRRIAEKTIAHISH